MRAKVLRYAPEARQDLADIRAYFHSRAGPAVAARMLVRLREAVAAIRDQPLTGTPRPEFGANCRFAVERPYVIYYDFDGGQLAMLRILHQARDRGAIMSRLKRD